MKSTPTSKKHLSRLPATCPNCGSHQVTWSPTRVWCTMCSFQTAAKEGEKSPHIVRRWNRAVRDGVGYCDILAENRERELKKYIKQQQ